MVRVKIGLDVVRLEWIRLDTLWSWRDGEIQIRLGENPDKYSSEPVQRINSKKKICNRFFKDYFLRLAGQYQKALSEVNETYQFYVSMLDERRAEIARELEQVPFLLIFFASEGRHWKRACR